MSQTVARLAAAATAAVLVVAVLPGTSPGVSAAPGSPGAAADRSQPADYRFLRARVFTAPGLGQLAVGMPTERVVKVQHRLAGDSSWSAPRTLFTRKGTTCGDIGGHASPGGVALILECDTPYYEDTAPVGSRAVVTRDLTTFSTSRLPGEAYTDPGISPTGEHAVWLTAGIGDFVTWTAGSGFSEPRSSGFDNDSGSSAGVVADDGTVTVAGGDSVGDRCLLGLYAVSPTGGTDLQRVDVAPGAPTGCTEFSVDGASSTRLSAAYTGVEGRWVVGRDDESSPWRLLTRAPATAPGLARWPSNPRRGIGPLYSSLAGQPLLAIGSPDRRRIQVQRYDAAAQRWQAPRTVYDHGFAGCTAGYEAVLRSSSVHAVVLHCWPRRRADGEYPPFDRDYETSPRNARRALLSPDGQRWRSVPVAARPVTLGLERQQVAAPSGRRTTIVSPRGFSVQRAGAPGRCDAVLPIGPAALLRLRATRGSRGFPARLQRWTGARWRSVARIPVPAAGRCRRVYTVTGTAPGRFFLSTASGDRGLRVSRRGDGFQVRPARGY